MTKRERGYCDHGGAHAILLGLVGFLSAFLSFLAMVARAASPHAQPAVVTSPARFPIPSADALKNWRAAMVRVHPAKKGCFKSLYPSTQWQEIPCSTEKLPPPLPAHRRPAIVGGSSTFGGGLLSFDLTAAATGNISSATGSFDSGATTITGETGNTTNADCSPLASDVPDTFSLQVNTDVFPITADSLSGWQCLTDPCQGLQQFVYQTSPANTLSIWYWIINPTSGCPTGWTQTTSFGELQCYQFTATPVAPAITAAELPSVTLKAMADAAGSLDTAELAANGQMYRTVQGDELNLIGNGNWIEAEFNVFGVGCGSQANFASGSTVTVNTSVNDGTTNIPACDMVTFTAETNNLNLQLGSSALGGASPAIQFIESGDPFQMPACAIANSHGDTHLTTFAGLLYDFQASGDFTLIKAPSGFTVQARQVPAKPRWPNASFNTAVGTQMGKTRVALCLHPTRLMVDGKSTELGDGNSLSLPSGVYLRRKSNQYLFAHDNGDSVTATVRKGVFNGNFTDAWIDVSIGLGRWPSKVTGLLASSLANDRELPARSRTEVKVPVSFDSLYHQYADTWRVRQDESLLCDANVESGIPQAPFYAKDLDPESYQRARESCVAEGVKGDALLDACILDVTVLGNKTAAEVYQHARVPRTIMPRPVFRGNAKP